MKKQSRAIVRVEKTLFKASLKLSLVYHKKPKRSTMVLADKPEAFEIRGPKAAGRFGDSERTPKNAPSQIHFLLRNRYHREPERTRHRSITNRKARPWRAMGSPTFMP